MMSAESPIRSVPISIHGDLPLGPLLGSLATTNSKGIPAMRNQVSSLSGNGADVLNGTPQPVPKAKSRILFIVGFVII
jgi:hypothetical protein